jgi:hypothetical protein
MSIMSDMAKNEAMYKGKKLIGVVIDPTALIHDDGSLDVDALCDEVMNWFKIQTAKIEADKKAAEGKDG